MPDTTVLEVREPSSTQARTLELGAPSVRIGRGPQCEVRLGEPSLAEVQCLLRRRGDTWHVQPVGPPGYLSIQGRPVETQRPLPLGEPMKVGEHWLMLSRLRAEDLDRTLTVAPTPTLGQGRSFGPAESPRATAPKPSRAPASRLIPSRPDDRRWEGRPLDDGIRERIARPPGPSAPLSARETAAPIRPARPAPMPSYEARATPPSFPTPQGYPGRPEQTSAPVIDRAPSPVTPPPPAPASPQRLGCATIVRDAPPPACLPDLSLARSTSEGISPSGTGAWAGHPPRNPEGVGEGGIPSLALRARGATEQPEPKSATSKRPTAPAEPSSTLASLPGLEAWAAELLERAQAAYPSPSTFPADWLAGPSSDVMDVEVIEPESVPAPPTIEEWAEPRVPEDGPPVSSGEASPVDDPVTEPVREVPPDEGSPAVVDVPAPPVPQIAISFEKPPAGLHRYLASIRRKRRSEPADAMARVVEAMPVVPADPGPIEAEARVAEDRPEAVAESTPTPEDRDVPRDEPLDVPQALAEPELPGRPGAQEDAGSPAVVVEVPASEASAVEQPPVEPVRDRPDLWSRDAAIPPPVEIPEIRPSLAEPAEPPPVAGDWPTARSILDSASKLRAVGAPQPSTSTRRSSASLPVPTVARPPAQWNLPGWFWIPSMLATLAVGGVGLWLSACQAEVLMSAGPLADRAASHKAPTVGDQIQAVAPSKLVKSAAWWNSPAEAVWPRAWALDEADGDPVRAEAVREWLDRARATSPALTPVRYALVSHATADDRDRTEQWPVGMGRDVLARTLLGRRLLDEGKVEAGRAAYREALDMASRARELGLPAFDDKETRRYRLPEEDVIGLVVADLAGRPDIRLADWLDLLGDRRLPMLVAGRMLKARGNFEGDRLLEKAAEPLAEGENAWDVAAEAEALALLSRFDAAEAAYQEALEALPEGQGRRILLHNLADILRRRGDEAAARSSLKAACGDQVDDPIGRRSLRVIAEIDRARRGTSLAEGRAVGGRKPSSTTPR